VRPWLLVDVDGPLNAYAAQRTRRPDGYATHRLITPRWEDVERRRLSALGMPYKRIKPLRVWLNPSHGAALTHLPFELAWATTWEEEANEYIAPLIGLPRLPVVTWSPQREAAAGVFWKTPQIVTWADGRPFAWIDDEITETDRAWVAEHHRGPALLHRVDPRIGLLPADFVTLTTWAIEHTQTTPHARTGQSPASASSANR
jgi:hypothetical protein